MTFRANEYFLIMYMYLHVHFDKIYDCFIFLLKAIVILHLCLLGRFNAITLLANCTSVAHTFEHFCKKNCMF